jgi:hypothetical protein
LIEVVHVETAEGWVQGDDPDLSVGRRVVPRSEEKERVEIRSSLVGRRCTLIDMSTLLEELRNAGFQYHSNPLLDRAADEIERLTNELDVLIDNIWHAGKNESDIVAISKIVGYEGIGNLIRMVEDLKKRADEAESYKAQVEELTQRLERGRILEAAESAVTCLSHRTECHATGCLCHDCRSFRFATQLLESVRRVDSKD